MMDKLLKSSADPAKISMFIKSLAVFAVLFGVDQTVVDSLQIELLNFATALAMLISAGAGVWGLVRKVELGRWSAAE
jgi:predicted oxidoreductase (fatty acid repression mutant protein)